MPSILVTGANGQIGSELVDRLRQRHGPGHVVGLDLHPPTMPNGDAMPEPYVVADVRDRDALHQALDTHDVDTVYHLASLLSASGEKAPDQAWEVNLGGLKNVLDLAREHDVRVFWPSSIAVFGPSTPRENTPQETVLDPNTMYGVTKRSGELLCRYYHRRYDVDVRSLRYPGLISYATEPGGGTTDYAVDMFRHAADDVPYTCFVRADTRLPMMYMPDAIRATLDLMDVAPEQITVRESYNVSAMTVTAAALADAIRAHVPSFECTYVPDARQSIADAWPASVDDHRARNDWNWSPSYDLDAMTEDMLAHLLQPTDA